MAKKTIERYVVVATSSRPWSVIAGVLVREDNDVVELRDARMILSWDAHGLLAVARSGPGSGGRVSPAVGRARVRRVELLLDVTPEARESIEASPWS